MRYMLGAFEAGPETATSSPGKNHYVDWHLELDLEEYEKCNHVLSLLRDFEHNSQLFTMIVWNFQDYHDTIEAYLQAFIYKDMEHLQYRPAQFNINRIALNVLSSIRMYLDHVETSLKRRYGEASEEVKNFEKICSKVYDENFSYRLLYRLRNYAQHCGFPINDICFMTEKVSERVEHRLLIRISRDKLLEGFNWKSLKPEIVASPDYFDFNEHLTSMMQSINEVHTFLIEHGFSQLKNDVSYIQNILSRVNIERGEPSIFALDIDESQEGLPLKKMTVIGIPLRLINAVASDNLREVTTDATLVSY